MKQLLTASLAFIILLCGASLVSAQTATTTTKTIPPSIASPWLTSPIWTAGNDPAAHISVAPLQGQRGMEPLDNQGITFFQNTGLLHPWVNPFQFQIGDGNGGTVNALFYVTGEWFTIPNVDLQGYVDSVTVSFSSFAANSDTVYVSLVPDAIRNFGISPFHVPDLSQAPFSKVAIPVAQFGTTGKNITIKYPHLAVDADFHVIVFPRILVGSSGISYSSQYTIVGDSEATRPRTIDNCHSNFAYLTIVNNQLQANPYIIDSFFSFGGGNPIFSNFKITAYVSSQPPMAQTVSISPDVSLDAGTVAVGSKDTTYAWIVNYGASPISVASLSAPQQTIFTVSSVNSLPATIPAGDSAKLLITFAPKNIGMKTSSFTITYSDGSTTAVALQGQGVQPPAGVAPKASQSSVELFPNPASTTLQLQGLASAGSYEISDLLGRVVAQGTIGGDQRIDVSQLFAGRYNVLIKSGGITESHSVIVTK